MAEVRGILSGYYLLGIASFPASADQPFADAGLPGEVWVAKPFRPDACSVHSLEVQIVHNADRKKAQRITNFIDDHAALLIW